MDPSTLGAVWTAAWPWLGALVAIASTLDASLPQPAEGSHWLPLRKAVSFLAVNVGAASNGKQPQFSTWLLRILTPVLQDKGLLPKPPPPAPSTIGGATAGVILLLILVAPGLAACGSTGNTLQPGQNTPLAEQAVNLPQQAASAVIPAATPMQRALRLYALCTIIADDASSRALGEPVLAAAVYGGLSVAAEQLGALRASLKANAKPVLLNTKMFLAASALVPPVKAVARSDVTWIMGQVLNPNVSDILAAIEGTASRGALGVNETADAIAQMKDIQARADPNPVDDDFAPWAERIKGALDMLRPAAARPTS